jgi:hypothetical protein
MVEDLRRLSAESVRDPQAADTAAATEVSEEVVDDDGDITWLFESDTSSMEVCSGDDTGYRRRRRAWSGCRRALLGRRMLGVGEWIGDDEAHGTGDGDTWNGQ